MEGDLGQLLSLTHRPRKASVGCISSFCVSVLLLLEDLGSEG